MGRWLKRAAVAALVALAALMIYGGPSYAADQDTPLPADGVVSLERGADGWTITLASADASEVKLITPGQVIACSEHEGQPKNGHPLCDRITYTFAVNADCVMVQVDWTGNVHNSTDPRRCMTLPTPTPEPTPEPSVTPTPQPTPTEPVATPTPSPTATATPPTVSPSAAPSPAASGSSVALLAATGLDDRPTRAVALLGFIVVVCGAASAIVSRKARR